ncbi:hypothetical protein I7I53_09021 [Histoplasma capsulatum var. duboisii H88]|uniref:Uncharacterized protein n=1 Tax=Ajellomyces capsulatus (strain H88) TaxID=544711 RepID=A0A8A1L443_AJEC8|nr:hypothetical protein I7I53_09021 [Histoplasma capsulatum var. duboisii H88]
MQHPLCQSLGRLQALPEALFALVLGYSNVPLRAAKVLPMGGWGYQSASASALSLELQLRFHGLASTFGDVSGAQEVHRIHLHIYLFALEPWGSGKGHLGSSSVKDLIK